MNESPSSRPVYPIGIVMYAHLSFDDPARSRRGSQSLREYFQGHRTVMVTTAAVER